MIVAEVERIHIPFFFQLYDRASSNPFFKARLRYRIGKDVLVFFSLNPLVAPFHRYVAIILGVIAFFWLSFWLLIPAFFIVLIELFFQERFYRALILWRLKREKYSTKGIHFLNKDEVINKLLYGADRGL